MQNMGLEPVIGVAQNASTNHPLPSYRRKSSLCKVEL